MTTQLISLNRNDTRWIITLNRPDKRNALSDDLVGELSAVMQQARVADIPTLVFRGEGRNFCAGFDFSDFDAVSSADLLWRFVRIQQLLTQVLSYPGMTIGIAHGRNFGAGCDLFAACKVRLATPDARFRMPGVLFDLILGTRRLGELIGASHANRIQLSQAEFDAAEALRMGFITGSWESAPEGEEPLSPEQTMQAIDAALEPLVAGTAKLSSTVRHAITDALHTEAAHEDMGRLVESIMHGDIKARLARYLGR